MLTQPGSVQWWCHVMQIWFIEERHYHLDHNPKPQPYRPARFLPAHWHATQLAECRIGEGRNCRTDAKGQGVDSRCLPQIATKFRPCKLRWIVSERGCCLRLNCSIVRCNSIILLLILKGIFYIVLLAHIWLYFFQKYMLMYTCRVERISTYTFLSCQNIFYQ